MREANSYRGFRRNAYRTTGNIRKWGDDWAIDANSFAHLGLRRSLCGLAQKQVARALAAKKTNPFVSIPHVLADFWKQVRVSSPPVNGAISFRMQRRILKSLDTKSTRA